MGKHRQPSIRRVCLTGLAVAGAVAVLAVAPASAAEKSQASDSDCAKFKRYGQPVHRGDPTTDLLGPFCRKGYAIAYNNKTKSPDWVMEILEKKHITGPAKRKNDFEADPAALLKGEENADSKKIYPDQRSELCHYAGSGFDRGHQAPAADYKYEQLRMNDSFYLTNMSPQVGPSFNRAIWARLEERVRDLVETRKKLVIFTGPIYDATEKDHPDWILPEKAFIWGDCPVDKTKKSGVAVPDGFYKIVYDPKRRRILAFAFPNRRLFGRKIGEFRTTVREIEELTGLNFFPLLKRRTQNILEIHEGEMWRW